MRVKFFRVLSKQFVASALNQKMRLFWMLVVDGTYHALKVVLAMSTLEVTASNEQIENSKAIVLDVHHVDSDFVKGASKISSNNARCF